MGRGEGGGGREGQSIHCPQNFLRYVLCGKERAKWIRHADDASCSHVNGKSPTVKSRGIVLLKYLWTRRKRLESYCLIMHLILNVRT